MTTQASVAELRRVLRLCTVQPAQDMGRHYPNFSCARVRVPLNTQDIFSLAMTASLELQGKPVVCQDSYLNCRCGL